MNESVGMKINIENCIRNCRAPDDYMCTLEHLVRHLKMLRNATIQGDGQACAEVFFNLYHFSDTHGMDWRDVEEEQSPGER